MKKSITFLFTVLLSASALAQLNPSFTVDNIDPTFDFNNTTTGTYHVSFWTFGDGNSSNLQNPSNTYLNNGTYLTCLVVSDTIGGLSATYCDSIYVNNGNPTSFCAAQFIHSISGNQVSFTNLSLGTNLTETWSFGDGVTSSLTNPVHVYASQGTYVACLNVDDGQGCNDTYCLSITIVNSGNCNAQLSWYQDTSFTMTVAFADSSSGSNLTYLWDFGDGNSSTQANPQHQYGAPGYYNACLTIDDGAGCVDSSCSIIIVYGPGGSLGCSANFWYIDSTNSTMFYGQNQLFAGATYFWSFGDGSNGAGQYPIHNYATPGIYNVCLTVDDGLGCVTTQCQNINITGSGSGGTGTSCNSNFWWFQDTTQTATIYIINTASGGTQPYTYYWDFGDGNSSSNAYPSHTYASPGMYNVCLTIADAAGCTSTFCDSLVHVVRASGFTINVIPPTQLSTNEIEDFINIHIWPNPTSDVLNVQVSGISKMGMLQLFDMHGRLVLTTRINNTNNTINCSEFSEGVYMMQISGNDGTSLHTGKVVITK